MEQCLHADLHMRYINKYMMHVRNCFQTAAEDTVVKKLYNMATQKLHSRKEITSEYMNR